MPTLTERDLSHVEKFHNSLAALLAFTREKRAPPPPGYHASLGVSDGSQSPAAGGGGRGASPPSTTTDAATPRKPSKKNVKSPGNDNASDVKSSDAAEANAAATAESAVRCFGYPPVLPSPELQKALDSRQPLRNAGAAPGTPSPATSAPPAAVGGATASGRRDVCPRAATDNVSAVPAAVWAAEGKLWSELSFTFWRIAGLQKLHVLQYATQDPGAHLLEMCERLLEFLQRAATAEGATRPQRLAALAHWGESHLTFLLKTFCSLASCQAMLGDNASTTAAAGSSNNNNNNNANNSANNNNSSGGSSSRPRVGRGAALFHALCDCLVRRGHLRWLTQCYANFCEAARACEADVRFLPSSHVTVTAVVLHSLFRCASDSEAVAREMLFAEPAAHAHTLFHGVRARLQYGALLRPAEADDATLATLGGGSGSGSGGNNDNSNNNNTNRASAFAADGAVRRGSVTIVASPLDNSAGSGSISASTGNLSTSTGGAGGGGARPTIAEWIVSGSACRRRSAAAAGPAVPQHLARSADKAGAKKGPSGDKDAAGKGTGGAGASSSSGVGSSVNNAAGASTGSGNTVKNSSGGGGGANTAGGGGPGSPRGGVNATLRRAHEKSRGGIGRTTIADTTAGSTTSDSSSCSSSNNSSRSSSRSCSCCSSCSTCNGAGSNSDAHRRSSSYSASGSPASSSSSLFEVESDSSTSANGGNDDSNSSGSTSTSSSTTSSSSGDGRATPSAAATSTTLKQKQEHKRRQEIRKSISGAAVVTLANNTKSSGDLFAIRGGSSGTYAMGGAATTDTTSQAKQGLDKHHRHHHHHHHHCRHHHQRRRRDDGGHTSPTEAGSGGGGDTNRNSKTKEEKKKKSTSNTNDHNNVGSSTSRRSKGKRRVVVDARTVDEETLRSVPAELRNFLASPLVSNTYSYPELAAVSAAVSPASSSSPGVVGSPNPPGAGAPPSAVASGEAAGNVTGGGGGGVDAFPLKTLSSILNHPGLSRRELALLIANGRENCFDEMLRLALDVVIECVRRTRRYTHWSVLSLMCNFFTLSARSLYASAEEAAAAPSRSAAAAAAAAPLVNRDMTMLLSMYENVVVLLEVYYALMKSIDLPTATVVSNSINSNNDGGGGAGLTAPSPQDGWGNVTTATSVASLSTAAGAAASASPPVVTVADVQQERELFVQEMLKLDLQQHLKRIIAGSHAILQSDRTLFRIMQDMCLLDYYQYEKYQERTRQQQQQQQQQQQRRKGTPAPGAFSDPGNVSAPLSPLFSGGVGAASAFGFGSAGNNTSNVGGGANSAGSVTPPNYSMIPSNFSRYLHPTRGGAGQESNYYQQQQQQQQGLPSGHTRGDSSINAPSLTSNHQHANNDEDSLNVTYSALPFLTNAGRNNSSNNNNGNSIGGDTHNSNPNNNHNNNSAGNYPVTDDSLSSVSGSPRTGGKDHGKSGGGMNLFKSFFTGRLGGGNSASKPNQTPNNTSLSPAASNHSISPPPQQSQPQQQHQSQQQSGGAVGSPIGTPNSTQMNISFSAVLRDSNGNGNSNGYPNTTLHGGGALAGTHLHTMSSFPQYHDDGGGVGAAAAAGAFPAWLDVPSYVGLARDLLATFRDVCQDRSMDVHVRLSACLSLPRICLFDAATFDALEGHLALLALLRVAHEMISARARLASGDVGGASNVSNTSAVFFPGPGSPYGSFSGGNRNSNTSGGGASAAGATAPKTEPGSPATPAAASTSTRLHSITRREDDSEELLPEFSLGTPVTAAAILSAAQAAAANANAANSANNTNNTNNTNNSSIAGATSKSNTTNSGVKMGIVAPQKAAAASLSTREFTTFVERCVEAVEQAYNVIGASPLTGEAIILGELPLLFLCPPPPSRRQLRERLYQQQQQREAEIGGAGEGGADQPDSHQGSGRHHHHHIHSHSHHSHSRNRKSTAANAASSPLSSSAAAAAVAADVSAVASAAKAMKLIERCFTRVVLLWMRSLIGAESDEDMDRRSLQVLLELFRRALQRGSLPRDSGVPDPKKKDKSKKSSNKGQGQGHMSPSGSRAVFTNAEAASVTSGTVGYAFPGSMPPDASVGSRADLSSTMAPSPGGILTSNTTNRNNNNNTAGHRRLTIRTDTDYTFGGDDSSSMGGTPMLFSNTLASANHGSEVGVGGGVLGGVVNNSSLIASPTFRKVVGSAAAVAAASVPLSDFSGTIEALCGVFTILLRRSPTLLGPEDFRLLFALFASHEASLARLGRECAVSSLDTRGAYDAYAAVMRECDDALLVQVLKIFSTALSAPSAGLGAAAVGAGAAAEWYGGDGAAEDAGGSTRRRWMLESGCVGAATDALCGVLAKCAQNERAVARLVPPLFRFFSSFERPQAPPQLCDTDTIDRVLACLGAIEGSEYVVLVAQAVLDATTCNYDDGPRPLTAAAVAPSAAAGSGAAAAGAAATATTTMMIGVFHLSTVNRTAEKTTFLDLVPPLATAAARIDGALYRSLIDALGVVLRHTSLVHCPRLTEFVVSHGLSELLPFLELSDTLLRALPFAGAPGPLRRFWTPVLTHAPLRSVVRFANTGGVRVKVGAWPARGFTVAAQLRFDAIYSSIPLMELQCRGGAGSPVSLIVAGGDSMQLVADGRRTILNESHALQSFSANTWLHVCLVVSRAHTASVFLNGFRVGTGACTYFAPGAEAVVQIGFVGYNIAGGAFSLGEVTLWEEELTAPQVEAALAGTPARLAAPKILLQEIPRQLSLAKAAPQYHHHHRHHHHGQAQQQASSPSAAAGSAQGGSQQGQSGHAGGGGGGGGGSGGAPQGHHQAGGSSASSAAATAAGAAASPIDDRIAHYVPYEHAGGLLVNLVSSAGQGTPPLVARVVGRHAALPRSWCDFRVLWAARGGITRMVDWVGAAADPEELAQTVQLLSACVRHTNVHAAVDSRTYLLLSYQLKRVPALTSFNVVDDLLRMGTSHAHHQEERHRVIINRLLFEHVLSDAAWIAALPADVGLYLVKKMTVLFTPSVCAHASRNARFILAYRFNDRLLHSMVAAAPSMPLRLRAAIVHCAKQVLIACDMDEVLLSGFVSLVAYLTPGERVVSSRCNPTVQVTLPHVRTTTSTAVTTAAALSVAASPLVGGTPGAPSRGFAGTETEMAPATVDGDAPPCVAGATNPAAAAGATPPHSPRPLPALAVRQRSPVALPLRTVEHLTMLLLRALLECGGGGAFMAAFSRLVDLPWYTTCVGRFANPVSVVYATKLLLDAAAYSTAVRESIETHQSTLVEALQRHAFHEDLLMLLLAVSLGAGKHVDVLSSRYTLHQQLDSCLSSFTPELNHYLVPVFMKCFVLHLHAIINNPFHVQTPVRSVLQRQQVVSFRVRRYFSLARVCARLMLFINLRRYRVTAGKLIRRSHRTGNSKSANNNNNDNNNNSHNHGGSPAKSANHNNSIHNASNASLEGTPVSSLYSSFALSRPPTGSFTLARHHSRHTTTTTAHSPPGGAGAGAAAGATTTTTTTTVNANHSNTETESGASRLPSPTPASESVTPNASVAVSNASAAAALLGVRRVRHAKFRRAFAALRVCVLLWIPMQVRRHGWLFSGRSAHAAHHASSGGATTAALSPRSLSLGLGPASPRRDTHLASASAAPSSVAGSVRAEGPSERERVASVEERNDGTYFIVKTMRRFALNPTTYYSFVTSPLSAAALSSLASYISLPKLRKDLRDIESRVGRQLQAQQQQQQLLAQAGPATAASSVARRSSASVAGLASSSAAAAAAAPAPASAGTGSDRSPSPRGRDKGTHTHTHVPSLNASLGATAAGAGADVTPLQPSLLMTPAGSAPGPLPHTTSEEASVAGDHRPPSAAATTEPSTPSSSGGEMPDGIPSVSVTRVPHGRMRPTATSTTTSAAAGSSPSAVSATAEHPSTAAPAAFSQPTRPASPSPPSSAASSSSPSSSLAASADDDDAASLQRAESAMGNPSFSSAVAAAVLAMQAATAALDDPLHAADADNKENAAGASNNAAGTSALESPLAPPPLTVMGATPPPVPQAAVLLATSDPTSAHSPHLSSTAAPSAGHARSQGTEEGEGRRTATGTATKKFSRRSSSASSFSSSSSTSDADSIAASAFSEHLSIGSAPAAPDANTRNHTPAAAGDGASADAAAAAGQAAHDTHAAASAPASVSAAPAQLLQAAAEDPSLVYVSNIARVVATVGNSIRRESVGVLAALIRSSLECMPMQRWAGGASYGSCGGLLFQLLLITSATAPGDDSSRTVIEFFIYVVSRALMQRHDGQQQHGQQHGQHHHHAHARTASGVPDGNPSSRHSSASVSSEDEDDLLEGTMSYNGYLPMTALQAHGGGGAGAGGSAPTNSSFASMGGLSGVTATSTSGGGGGVGAHANNSNNAGTGPSVSAGGVPSDIFLFNISHFTELIVDMISINVLDLLTANTFFTVLLRYRDRWPKRYASQLSNQIMRSCIAVLNKPSVQDTAIDVVDCIRRLTVAAVRPGWKMKGLIECMFRVLFRVYSALPPVWLSEEEAQHRRTLVVLTLRHIMQTYAKSKELHKALAMRTLTQRFTLYDSFAQCLLQTREEDACVGFHLFVEESIGLIETLMNGRPKAKCEAAFKLNLRTRSEYIRRIKAFNASYVAAIEVPDHAHPPDLRAQYLARFTSRVTGVPRLEAGQLHWLRANNAMLSMEEDGHLCAPGEGEGEGEGSDTSGGLGGSEGLQSSMSLPSLGGLRSRHAAGGYRAHQFHFFDSHRNYALARTYAPADEVPSARDNNISRSGVCEEHVNHLAALLPPFVTRCAPYAGALGEQPSPQTGLSGGGAVAGAVAAGMSNLLDNITGTERLAQPRYPFIDDSIHLRPSAVALLRYLLEPCETLRFISNGFRVQGIHATPCLILLSDATLKVISFTRLTRDGDIIIAAGEDEDPAGAAAGGGGGEDDDDDLRTAGSRESSGVLSADAAADDKDKEKEKERTRASGLMKRYNNFSFTGMTRQIQKLLLQQTDSKDARQKLRDGSRVAQSVRQSTSKTFRNLFWSYLTNSITEVRCVPYMHLPTAVQLQMLHEDGPMLSFVDASQSMNSTARDDFLRVLREVLRDQDCVFVDPKPSTMLRAMLLRWAAGSISNHEYILFLNRAAGRNTKDYNQYPIFPWILADYTSAVLDLDQPRTFRDLSLPAGAQTAARRELLATLYKNTAEVEDPNTGRCYPFHHGTHYSTSGGVLYYLIRVEPFTTFSKIFQGGAFDTADRLFDSVEASYASVLSGPADCKELTPEFYSNGMFLRNADRLALGTRQDGGVVDHVRLPPWAKGSVQVFTAVMRYALECEHTLHHLHAWIDLVFGVRRRGPGAVERFNVFQRMTYGEEVAAALAEAESAHDIDVIIAEVDNFGQTPAQLFQERHPAHAEMEPVRSGTHAAIAPSTALVLALGNTGARTSSSNSGGGGSGGGGAGGGGGGSSASPGSGHTYTNAFEKESPKVMQMLIHTGDTSGRYFLLQSPNPQHFQPLAAALVEPFRGGDGAVTGFVALRGGRVACCYRRMLAVRDTHYYLCWHEREAALMRLHVRTGRFISALTASGLGGCGGGGGLGSGDAAGGGSVDGGSARLTAVAASARETLVMMGLSNGTVLCLYPDTEDLAPLLSTALCRHTHAVTKLALCDPLGRAVSVTGCPADPPIVWRLHRFHTSVLCVLDVRAVLPPTGGGGSGSPFDEDNVIVDACIDASSGHTALITRRHLLVFDVNGLPFGSGALPRPPGGTGAGAAAATARAAAAAPPVLEDDGGEVGVAVRRPAPVVPPMTCVRVYETREWASGVQLYVTGHADGSLGLWRSTRLPPDTVSHGRIAVVEYHGELLAARAATTTAGGGTNTTTTAGAAPPAGTSGAGSAQGSPNNAPLAPASAASTAPTTPGAQQQQQQQQQRFGAVTCIHQIRRDEPRFYIGYEKGGVMLFDFDDHRPMPPEEKGRDKK